MIDLHAHLIPGLDDGARDLDESVAIARAMAADGVRVVAATPHVRADYPTTPAAMESGLAAVRAALDEAGVELVVLGGGEVALAWLAGLDEDALTRFAIGGSRTLLLEPPDAGWDPALPRTLARLRQAGWRPVLAHPERNHEVQERPELLDEVIAAGALVQLTAAAVDGRLGRRPADTARGLLRERRAHLLASDAHAPGVREAGLGAAVRAIGDDALGRWLTVEVPTALLADADPPPRPPAGGPRRRWWPRRG